jgi:hypothetical protein
MEWVTFLVVALLFPVLIGLGMIRIARRFCPNRRQLANPARVYPVVLGVWLTFLAITFWKLQTASAPSRDDPVAAVPAEEAPAIRRFPWRPPTIEPPRDHPAAPAAPAAIPRFPWPPPAASSFVTISLKRLLPSTISKRPYLFSDVDLALRSALDGAGYFEGSYYVIPQGYALATRMESIESDGSPRPGQARWNVEPDSRDISIFSLSSYLVALFSAPPGRYRVIVFLVTSEPFAAKDATVSREETTRWLFLGGNQLPTSLRVQPLDPGTVCTAMIYEFQKDSSSNPAFFLRPGKFSANVHMIKTGLQRLIQ